jgi:hypothetical protein
MTSLRPLLLVGGPLDLDGSEIPDNYGTIREVDGHVYYVQRDWILDRWIGKYVGLAHPPAVKPC